MKSTVKLYNNIILDKLYKQAELYPAKICIECTNGETITYSEFVKQIDLTATKMALKGLSKGDKILFLARPTIQSIVHIFAVIRAGGVMVLADPAMGKENFISRIEFIKPKFLMVDPILSILIKIPFAEKLLTSLGVQLPNFSAINMLPQILVKKVNDDYSDVVITKETLNSTEDSMIIFTSGTTGTPKAVTHTYGSLFNILDKIENIFNIKDTDIFYSSQLHFLLAALLTGSKGILPKDLDFKVETSLSDMEKYNVNKTFGIPAEYNRIIEFCEKNNRKLPTKLDLVILGSAPVLKGFLLKLVKITPEHTKVFSVYGGTEILPGTYIEMREKLSWVGDGDNLGKAAPGVTVEIENDEIILSGNNLFNRYYSFDPVTKHYSGDLGKIDENGYVILLGRKKDMVIRKNFNIYPTIYENTISKIEGVRNCAMVGIYNDKDEDERVYLAVEKELGVKIDDKDLISKIDRELKSGDKSIDVQALPDKIIVMELPLSGRTFKVDKKKIKEYIINNNLS